MNDEGRFKNMSIFLILIFEMLYIIFELICFKKSLPKQGVNTSTIIWKGMSTLAQIVIIIVPLFDYIDFFDLI